MSITLWIGLLSLLRAVDARITAAALFPELSVNGKDYRIDFIQSSDRRDPIQVRASFDLGADSVSWQVHQLPIWMGSDACSTSELGACMQCMQVQCKDLDTPPENVHCPSVAQCISGTLRDGSSSLPNCAELSGKDGIVGRSLVLSKQRGRSVELYCTTIFRGGDQNPKFVSTISWFSYPFAGYTAFRKSSQEQSYIILNLTRVDGRIEDMASLKWDIRDADDRVVQVKANSDRDQCSQVQHKQCPEGELWRKHGRISLAGRGVNLQMFVDENLDTSILDGKFLTILNSSEGRSDQVVFQSPIVTLPGVSIDVTFVDYGVDDTQLQLNQRDPWSRVEHKIVANSRNPVSWVVRIYSVNTLRIFGGDEWDCPELWSQEEYLPSFISNTTTAKLDKKYTLYGRTSLLYHGVSIQTTNADKKLCSTITNKQGNEIIGYSKLVEEKKQDDQLVVVMVIQHNELHQTTNLIATMCTTNNFYLEVTSSSDCKGARELNPYNVQAASESNSSCQKDSSYLCPVGDLRNRLGLFPATTAKTPRTVERVFSVRNDVNLPIEEFLGNYIGFHMYSDIQTPFLKKCGEVVELLDTVVEIIIRPDISVKLSQKVAWQPITLTWPQDKLQLIKVKFSQQRTFSDNVCGRPTPSKQKEYSGVCASFSYSPCHLPKEGNGPTLFGETSRLYKSVEVEYRLLGMPGMDEVKETQQNLDLKQEPNTTLTHLQAVLQQGNDKSLKFDFYQRQNHLTDETYITVEVLGVDFCDKKVKWYIVYEDDVNRKMYKPGAKFEITDYDDSRLYNEHHGCPKDLPKTSTGDLSSKLDDLDGGPGTVVVHDRLSLIKVESHYLLVCEEDDTIIDAIQITKAAFTETPKTTSQEDVPSKRPWQMTLPICIGVGIIVILVVGGFIWKYCGQTGKRTYDSLHQNPYPTPKAEDTDIYRNRLTNRYVRLIKAAVSPYYYEVETEDCKTGDRVMAHQRNLVIVTQEEIPRYHEWVLHSTSPLPYINHDGSSMARSGENHYTMSSPTNQGSGSPLSSQSSLEGASCL